MTPLDPNAPPCECEFQYHYRWPQLYDALLSGDPVRAQAAVQMLDDRDLALELHFNLRCDDGGEFEYPVRWSQLAAGLLSPDQTDVHTTVTILEQRDQELQTHIAGLPCFGVDYAHGVTCEFEYPTVWTQLAPMLLSSDARLVREAVAQLQVRDIELETHLTNRVCHEPSGGLIWPTYQGRYSTIYDGGGSPDTFSFGPGEPAQEMFAYSVNPSSAAGMTVTGFFDETTYKIFDQTAGGARFRLYRRNFAGGAATASFTVSCPDTGRFVAHSLFDPSHVAATIRTQNAIGLTTYEFPVLHADSGALIWSWTDGPDPHLYGNLTPAHMLLQPGTPISVYANVYYGIADPPTSPTFGVSATGGFALQWVVTVDVTHL